jgi:hypothetical protein
LSCVTFEVWGGFGRSVQLCSTQEWRVVNWHEVFAGPMRRRLCGWLQVVSSV